MPIMSESTEVTESPAYDMRIEFWYGPDERLKTEPTLEAALLAEGFRFAARPAVGDHFNPGVLGTGILGWGASPRVKFIEHWPAVPEGMGFAGGDSSATVVVACESRRVVTDETLARVKADGWRVMDFRESTGHARIAKR